MARCTERCTGAGTSAGAARHIASTPRSESHAPTAVDRALDVVLGEIDQIAKATFSSITLATMLQLVARQRDNGG